MDSFAWDYIDLVISKYLDIEQFILQKIYHEIEKVRRFLFYAYQPPTILQWCQYLILLVFVGRFLVEDQSFFQNILVGLLSSLLVTWLLEAGHNYHENLRKIKARKSYHEAIRKFISDVRYESAIENQDILYCIFLTLWYLYPNLIKSCDRKMWTLQEEEYVHIENVIRRICEIRLAVKKEVEKLYIEKIKQHGVIMDVMLFDYLSLDNKISSIFSTEDSLKKFCSAKYNISLDTLQQSSGCPAEVNQCEEWNRQIAECLISDNCYGIGEEMIELIKLAEIWPDMNDIECEFLLNYYGHS